MHLPTMMANNRHLLLLSLKYTSAYARPSHNTQAQINSLWGASGRSSENKSLSELMQNEMSFKKGFSPYASQKHKLVWNN